MVSCGYGLCFNIEFPMNHHVVYSSGSAATFGHWGLPILPPRHPPASITATTCSTPTKGAIRRCYLFTTDQTNGTTWPNVNSATTMNSRQTSERDVPSDASASARPRKPSTMQVTATATSQLGNVLNESQNSTWEQKMQEGSRPSSWVRSIVRALAQRRLGSGGFTRTVFEG